MSRRAVFILSDTPVVRAAVTHAWVRQAAQSVGLVLVLVLAGLAWGVSIPAGVDSKLFGQSHITTLLVWGIWWPSVVVSALWLGRVWCAICPLELVSHAGERMRSAFGGQGFVVGRHLAAGWAILVLYAVVQILIGVVQVHRVPAWTAWYLVSLLGLALGTGVLFKHRAYCRAFCPVGMLLKIYGRGAAIAVRPSEPASLRHGRPVPVCPTRLNPLRLDVSRGDDCLLCGDCCRTDPGRAMRVEARVPWAHRVPAPPVASLPLTLFIMLVSGFVAYEVTGIWPATKTAFLATPDALVAQLGLRAWQEWVRIGWTLFAFPLVVWTALAVFRRFWSTPDDLVGAWRRLAYPASLVVAAGHLTKAIEKLSSWIGFLPLAWKYPGGEPTARGIADGSITKPVSWISHQAVAGIGLTAVAVALWLVWRERRHERSGARAGLPELTPTS